MFPEIWSAIDRTCCHFVLFFCRPPTHSPPHNNPENKNFDNMCLEISSFYTNVPIITICYTVPKMIWRMTYVIGIFHFGYFLSLYHPSSLKNQNFLKMKKTPGDIILHTCTKIYDQMMYCS